MFSRAVRQQSHANQGYLCLTCRHQFAALRRQHGAQTRHNSTEPVSATDDQDYFSNFNSLSEDFTSSHGYQKGTKSGGPPQHAAKEPKKRREQHSEPGGGSEESVTARRNLELESLLRNKPNVDTEGVTQHSRDRPNRADRRAKSVSTTKAERRRARKERAARRAEAQQHVPQKSDLASAAPKEASTNAAVDAERQEPSSFVSLREASEAGNKLENNGDESQREQISPLAALRKGGRHTSEDAQRLQFERIMSQLQPESSGQVNEPEHQEAGTQPGDNIKVDSLFEQASASEEIEVSVVRRQLSPVDDPDFTSSIRDAVPLRFGSSRRPRRAREDQNAAQGNNLAAASSVVLPSNPQRTYSFAKRPTSPLLDRLRESSNRPQWGGKVAPAAIVSKATSESLREADKVSFDPPKPASAGLTKPWGLSLGSLWSRWFSGSHEQSEPGRPSGESSESRSDSTKPSGQPASEVVQSGVDEKESVKGRSDSVDPLQHESMIESVQEAEPAEPVLQPDPTRSVRQSGSTAPVSQQESAGSPQRPESSSTAQQAESRKDGRDAEPMRPDRHSSDLVKTGREHAYDAAGGGKEALAVPSTRLVKSKVHTRKEALKKPESKSAMSEEGSAPKSSKLESRVPARVPSATASDISSMAPGNLDVEALRIEQPAVPPLQYGLDRVLFNQGVYQLQDPHSRVYNFDPYLQEITPIRDFDFNSLKEYKTSSQDQMLSTLAAKHGKKYVGSTSSMTGTLAHFHYLLSNWRELNLQMLSRAFPETYSNFTNLNRAPNAIFLRWKDGTYAIDADKEFDGANILMMLGKSMEKVLTVPREEYERHLKGSKNAITPDEKEAPESYEYTAMGDFLMRSQLDAYDPRLPGTGMFDLKTRAVISIRMDAENFEPMLGYEIQNLQGKYNSYEREYYDMMRSTMLKYMLQARMGRMDGIFLAYHNIQRIFGFQYMRMAEIDRAIHGQEHTCLGNQEFKASINMLNKVLEMATKQYPEQDLRLFFETVDNPTTMMWVFAEPMESGEVDKIQSSSKEKVAEFEKTMMGIVKDEPAAATESEAEVKNERIAEADNDDSSDSSITAADPKFFSNIGQASVTARSDSHRPLFVATIICRNFVNGKSCPGNRPENLNPDDEWSVEYILKETRLPPADKWARYEDMKMRRRKCLEREVEEADEEREASGYIKMLQRMAKEGREKRSKIDELEKGKKKIVVGEPIYKA